MRNLFLKASLFGIALTTSVIGASGQSLLALQSKAVMDGTVRVIVTFDEPELPVSMRGRDDAASERAGIASIRSVQTDILARATSRRPSDRAADGDLTLMDYSPMFALNADATELSRLAADPRVTGIVEDTLNEPTLNHSVKQIGMLGSGGAYKKGATGKGRAVAIIDTGVLKSHEFLKGKVISEACYNTKYKDSANKVTSLCPGGALASTKSGAGADCAVKISGCGHGTHVAGIAAGKNTSKSKGEPSNGVAKDAAIVAIRVFSKVEGNWCSTSPCVLAFTSDVVKGLERVYALRKGVKNRKIDAVNMSLGGGGSTGYCNGDARAPIINKLRNAGIATVISSGNNGYINGVSAPACVKSAIAVGAISKSSSGFKARIAYYSNQGPQVDILAPGGDASYPKNISPSTILSSYGNGRYEGLQGTSMAAPHVAGAIAAIRSRAKCRGKSVSAIESAFRSTGASIKDHRKAPGYKQITKRALSVPAVMKKLGCG